MIHPTAKVSEEVNRKLPAWNTTLQFLTLFTDPEHHNAHCTAFREDRQMTLWC